MTRALVAGIRSETTGTGLRLGLNRAADRTRTDNERAERSASSKRYTNTDSGRCPALRDPFHPLSE
jgi:hypothetical protein